MYLISHRVVVVPSDPVGRGGLCTSVRSYSKVLQRMLDRYGAYIAHLSTVVEDRSIKPVDRSRLKGYLLKWKHPEILVGYALYTEVLKLLSILSLTLQSDSSDIVTSMKNTLKAVKALKTLAKEEPNQ